MLRFSRSILGLAEALKTYPKELTLFEPDTWLLIEKNLAITDDRGNWALFDLNSDGIYTGHYLFKARGKEAKKLAIGMIDYFFKNSEASVLRGLTPLEELGARWLTRQLGFKGYGVVQTVNGPCELFLLTRQEWETNNESR